MRRLGVVLVAAIVGLAPGCGDDVQYVSPRETPQRRAEAPPQHLPPGHPPVGGARAQTQPIDPHGTMGGGAAPNPQVSDDPFADPSEADTPIRSDDGAAVPPAHVWYAGRVELDPSFQLPPTYALFVCAGPPPAPRIPTITRRYDQPTFPFTFELRQQDIFGDSKVDRPLALYVIFSEAGYVMAERGLYFKTPLTEVLPLESKDVVLTVKKP